MTLVGDRGLVCGAISHGSSQILSSVSYMCICDGGCSDGGGADGGCGGDDCTDGWWC